MIPAHNACWEAYETGASAVLLGQYSFLLSFIFNIIIYIHTFACDVYVLLRRLYIINMNNSATSQYLGTILDEILSKLYLHLYSYP